MALYRVIRSLVGPDHDRIEKGTVLSIHWGRGRINALITVGAISRVSSPPLSELPDWKTRAGKLAKIGIITAEDFIEGDSSISRKCLGIRSSGEVQHLKEQVLKWLQPDKPDRGPCGSC